MESYQTIRKNTQHEITEKKSKFIANVFKVEKRQEIQEHLKEVKKKYHEARHYCYAYRILDKGSIIEKSSDDGEPSGTAGAPILSLLKNENLVNVLVIVTRYFGGVLLGTGGLIRAYSEVAVKGLAEAKRSLILEGEVDRITLDYKDLASFQYYCKKKSISILEINYGQTVEITIELSIREKNELKNNLSKASFCLINAEKLGKKYIQKNADI